MNKSYVGLILAVAIGYGISWIAQHVHIRVIPTPTPSQMPANGPESDSEALAGLNEHEEADVLAERVALQFKPIHLGDLSITCPVCGTEVDSLHVAIGTAEDRESGEGEFNDLMSVGFINYACGHVLHSPCLTDKVMTILNAEEIGRLKPEMFANLQCEEHGE